ncbi:MAG: chaperone GrpE [Parcubacteria group bacterium Athens0714_25]|nr:MAG: chaperone GrpE [Parcubacteria group bacterium Athens0714_25]
MKLKKNKKNEEDAKKDDEVKMEIDEKEDGEKKSEKNKENEYLDGWKRCQADFENYKKRQEESRKDLLRYSTENIVMQIIPVLDNFQSATAHIPEDQSESAWVQGIMYIQKQLESVLKENGVNEIEVKTGDNFDTKFHEAAQEKECQCAKCDCEKEKFKNKISKIILKGYKIEDKVIRPARVVVE